MNLLFIGGFFPKDIEATVVKDTFGKIGFSNHNFEKSLIKGFSKQDKVNLRVISAPKTFAYPHNNKNIFIKKERYIEDGVSISSIGYFNLTGINRFCIVFQLLICILSELKKFKGKTVHVVVNTPTLEYSLALFWAKKLTTKRLKTLLIIPDIPECMVEMSGKTGLKSKIISELNRLNRFLSRKYDRYVYLTEAMNDYYQADESRYIIVEGLINEIKDINIEACSFRNEIDREIILYTGSLKKIFGILDLVEAFERCKFNNIELWICGSGETSDFLIRKTHENRSIKFFGCVSPEKALELQKQATILVNPRSSEGNYTKYSFPSKTIEYLLAGKTVLANKLPGIPVEYDQFIFYPQNETVEAWVQKLRDIISMDKDKRSAIASAGRDFILSNKTANIQCKRILSLFDV